MSEVASSSLVVRFDPWSALRRSALTVADMERLGGVSPHVSPLAHGR